MDVKRWPYPPSPVSLLDAALSNTIVLILYFESGTGSLKLMMRFLTSTPSQSINEVTLLTESIGTFENFSDIHKYFGPTYELIKGIQKDGIFVRLKIVNVELFFVADFKIIYSVTGSF